VDGRPSPLAPLMDDLKSFVHPSAPYQCRGCPDFPSPYRLSPERIVTTLGRTQTEDLSVARPTLNSTWLRLALCSAHFSFNIFYTTQACGAAAPFCTVRGQPYLEPHHIHRLSDGGPDDLNWVASVPELSSPCTFLQRLTAPILRKSPLKCKVLPHEELLESSWHRGI
jgi:hypothetical protein